MKCPKCQSDVADSSDHCFNCGHVFKSQQTLIRGSIIAGRFEILAPLGKGGMGMVYKARDHKLEETVAIKVLRPDIASEPDMERRFRTEIRLARRVRHRNVCGIHEYGDDGPLRYIAMEYIEGVDIRKILVESGGLPVEEAFDTCIHTAEGLQAIHEAGIIHRDLKTANLMRDSQGVVRLMDFGIAKQVGAEATLGATATGLVVGTPEYMSPEQARGGKIDHRSDIYALGIVAFEVFTGRVPFRGETPIATIFKHLQDPPPLEGPGAEALPASVVPVLRRALAKEPDERFANAAEFAVAMTQARDAAGVSPLARGPSTPRPATTAVAERPAGATPPPSGVRGATPQPAPTVVPRSGPTVVAPPGSQPTVVRPATRSTRAAEPARVEATRVMAPPAAPASSAPVGLLIGVAAVLLLGVLGGAAFFLWPKPPAPTPTPPVPSPTPIPAVVGGNGTLVIDASPWGEVVDVVDGGGKHFEPSGARYTPLAIPVPPGTYTIQVKNPGSAEPFAKAATVQAAGTETVSFVFRRVNAQDYFQKTGL